jgi:hypothetical protein
VGQQRDHHRRQGFLADRTDQMARFAASGWDVFECDGHDPEDIDRALTRPRPPPGPPWSPARPISRLGHAAQDTSKGHGALTDGDQLLAAKKAYGWPHGPFEVPADIKAEWEAIGARGAPEREEWETRFALLSDNKQAEFRRAFAGEMPKRLSATIRALKKQVSTSRPQRRHAQGLGNGAGGDQPDPARDHRRLGGPDGVEQHQDRRSRHFRAGEPQGPLCLLRHPRTRHGGGDERHGAPWRRAALWRHLHVLRRLRAAVDAAFGADGAAGAIRDDP